MKAKYVAPRAPCLVPADFDQISFVYRPMWRVRRKVVSSYWCLPACATPSGPLLIGDAILPPQADSTLIAELDLLILRRVIEDLTDLDGRNRQVVIALPIHLTTLAGGRTQREFIRLCHSIPQRCRRLVIAELIGLLDGRFNRPLSSTIAMLRPFVRALIARIPLDDPEFAGLAGVGLFAVGVDFANDRGLDPDFIWKMEYFTERADRERLKTYARGLRSLSLTTAAVCAGFNYIDGDAVTSLIDAPQAIYPLSAENLYTHLISAPAAGGTAL